MIARRISEKVSREPKKLVHLIGELKAGNIELWNL